METHVSSTTADVPASQVVIDSHGNVEMVIVVEKLDEEQQHKADSNTQDNGNKIVTCLVTSPQKDMQIEKGAEKSTKKDGQPSLLNKQEHSQMSKEPESKNLQPQIKIQQISKQLLSTTTKVETQAKTNRLSEKHDTKTAKSTSTNEAMSQDAVDSTSLNHNLEPDKLNDNNKIDSPAKELVTVVIPLDISVKRETLNDSKMDTSSDISEKEHNKSISRELKSLINSAKESKIISECTQLTSKTRKSRVALDASNTTLNTSNEADSIQGNRRGSSNSQQSNCSEKSENAGTKRSMRSQNPEFVHKVKQFLNSVTGKFQKPGDSDGGTSSDEEMELKNKENNQLEHSPVIQRKIRKQKPEQALTKNEEKSNKLRSDPYCWRCHWAIEMSSGEKAPQTPVRCTVCPRSFHFKCLSGSERTKISADKNWVCPECMTVLHAESSETRSSAMKKISLGMLCELLKYALQGMLELNGVDAFMHPVDRTVFPDYDKYVVHPMDLTLMKEHIAEGLYGSTEAFLADAQWILHNTIIFNTVQSKLTASARALVRSCRAEMGEIEACPECYAAAHARRPTWFTDVCSTPHVLLWAKLKGFPYWPAKAMTVNSAGLVDVRFFGAHDRAWVPARDCFLYSEKDPNNFRTKRQDIIDSMQEAEQHIRNISRKYGKFVYPPFRSQFDPTKLEEQLKLMIPSFEGEVKSPIKDKRDKTPSPKKTSRSSSKGSKDGHNTGDDASDREGSPLFSRKMADGAEIAREEDSVGRKLQSTPLGSKRRRSKTKERSFTVSPKRKRFDSGDTEQEVSKIECEEVSTTEQTTEKSNDSEKKLEVPEKNTKENEIKDNTLVLVNSATLVTKPNSENEKIASPVNSTPIKEIPSLVCEKSVPATQISDLSNKSTETIITTEGKTTTSELSKDKCIPQSTKVAEKSDTVTEKPKTTPVKAIVISKPNRQTPKVGTPVLKMSTPKTIKDSNDSITPALQKKKSIIKEKSNLTETENIPSQDDKSISQNSRSSRSNKSLSNSDISQPNKCNADSSSNNKTSKNSENEAANKNNLTISETVSITAVSSNKNQPKPKSIEDNVSTNNKEAFEKKTDNVQPNKNKKDDIEKSLSEASRSSPKPGCSKEIKRIKQPVQLDANTSLAMLTLDTATVKPVGAGESTSAAAMPTISSVRSLSASPAASTDDQPVLAAKANTRSAANAKIIQVTVEVNPDSSIFTPTSTDNVRNMRDAINKLQKLRGSSETPPVGRVGVRSFARMTSPPEKSTGKLNNCMLVDIKAEPMDYEDCEDQPETSSVLNSSWPQPASAVASTSLRDVRKNKVVTAPPPKKTVKMPDIRPRAKKTFPQPKKTDDGRSELTNKNTMVYIPIQPPMTQAPVRAAVKPAAPASGPSTSTAGPRTPQPIASTSTSIVGSSMAPPQLPMAPPPSPMAPPPLPMAPPPPPVAPSTVSLAPSPLPMAPPTLPIAPSTLPLPSPTLPSSASAPVTTTSGTTIIVGPTFSNVPTTVHTVPLITSVNGQWTFSLQPLMSVGDIDGVPAPLMNGLPDRVVSTAAPAPALAASAAAPAATTPLPPLVPTVVPAAGNNPAPNRTPDPLGEPPQLQPRPLQNPLSTNTPIGDVPTPSAAGPLTTKLNQNAVKLADFFRTLLEESLEHLDDPASEVARLKLQLEQARWQHLHELAELRHTHELLVVEMRSVADKVKTRAVSEARRLAHQELEAAVKHAKSKQWCANCSQEAQFYCCWNTSYCDYPCQRAHWAQHYSSCTQQRTQSGSTDGSSNSPISRLHSPDNVPKLLKTTAASTLTPGEKVSRPAAEPASVGTQKPSVIVNVAEEPSGGSAMKCVGTFKQTTPTMPQTPLIINKQLMNTEENSSSGKKMVTSGGYLIVGMSATSSSSLVSAPAQSRAPPHA